MAELDSIDNGALKMVLSPLVRPWRWRVTTASPIMVDEDGLRLNQELNDHFADSRKRIYRGSPRGSCHRRC